MGDGPGSIPVAIFPSCQEMKIIALSVHKHECSWVVKIRNASKAKVTGCGALCPICGRVLTSATIRTCSGTIFFKFGEPSKEVWMGGWVGGWVGGGS